MSRRDEAASLDRPDVAKVRELLPRYDKPGPRYTSYPTAPVWSEEVGESDLREVLAARAPSPLSVYVHIPFCRSLCTYCACNREISRDGGVADTYLDHLAVEARMLGEIAAPGTRSASVAIGGGTPTFLDPEQLARLCDILDEHFPAVPPGSPGAERSIEVDPRTTHREQLEVLAKRGFDRISLGVQDLSPVVQKAIHREQSLEETAATAASARELGFRSVNFDLIYGLPFQTVDSFGETLDAVLALRPDRIALYSYAHVTWVSKQQRGFERKDLPDAARKLDIFSLAVERLCDAGYRYLGLDHFALPEDELCRAADDGSLRRNFMGYTSAAAPGGEQDVLALGCSGISELPGLYTQSHRSSADWSATLDAGHLPTLRGWRLDADDLRRRWLIQRLMCQNEIRGDAYFDRFGERLDARIPDLEARLAPFVADGVLLALPGGWRLSAEGRLLMRPVAMAFDAYLGERDESAAPRFSRTV
jgi:oxygen-independent coproporphyrinogen-3 oxidase